MTHRSRGFTLIELLAALVIMALLSIAGYRGLDAVLQTREHIAQETRKWQHLAFCFSRLEQDVAQAIHRPVQDQDGRTQPEWVGRTVAVANNEAELTFTRTGVPGEGENMLAPQRIGYRLQQGSIVLLRWPFPDQAPRTEPVRYPLLEGVREFHLRHLDTNGNWLEQWPSEETAGNLPTALEVAVTLASGEKITRVFALQ
ncbi:type II secretion system protein J [Ferrigenium kumadai]|uniref:Type II secretion system protein J n=1 Tax=Ferrigenium kumadai TaxID=1682490 RepID=A0AAN1W0G0_9PROT|nr:type II secretion system minor pseudopilin GspJ [Ferrigenium kumadai]BBJ00429.1 type II secretion system protein J [Ferrigenium kumadai]